MFVVHSRPFWFKELSLDVEVTALVDRRSVIVIGMSTKFGVFC